ncbi:MAG: NADH-quinone oxidoreductase subunit L [Methanophagales archaeon]|nr:NADH-quinone oxidoreductase subunit L [Methanophagales archaeon]
MIAAEVAWLCVLSPFAGALLSPVLARIHPKLRDYGAVFLSFLAALCSVMLIPYLFHPEKLPIESAFVWLSFPIELKAGVLIDPLSIVMANVVAVISFIIMVYSLGYMKGDPSLTRWWMWMNLFIGSMLLLVLSNNLLFLFIGWKMVGLCSWGLIGFYKNDEKKYWIGGPAPTKYTTPSHCGLKAMVVTSAGDVVMLGGMLLMYAYSGTLNILELYETSSIWLPEMAKSSGMILLMSILLLAGPIGKSAQFPLHEWLPEAMAGPGPVSALIHAATMVKSGVYLVARLVPIFFYGYWVAGCSEASYFFILIAWIGAITAFLAATQGMVALELKKALAYSTVSQIGYMMLALGVTGLTAHSLMGGFTSGMFHLVNHALFKACLFLCAGSVIHTAHSIYMNDMGSIRKYMPFTWIFMVIAALSLMGVPPFPGFWSKDAILLSCLEAHNYPLFLFALITVVLTAFYTLRFIGMTFYGKESKNVENLKRKGVHLGEARLTMVVACGVLAITIIVLGIFGLPLEHLLHEGFGYTLVEKLHLPVEHATEMPHLLVPLLSVISVVIGIVPAYLLYFSGKLDPAGMLEKHASLKMLHKFFWNRWYIDRFYYMFFVGGMTELFTRVPKYIENPLDKLYHEKVPAGLIALSSRVPRFIENPLDRFYHMKDGLGRVARISIPSGMIAIFSRVPKYVENPLDRFYHMKDSMGRVARISIPSGMIAIFSRVPKYIENPLDRFYHMKDSLGRVARISIPAIPGAIYSGTKRIRIETGYLGYNLIYVLIFYIGFIILILLIFLGVIT